MSLARRHRERMAALQAATSVHVHAPMTAVAPAADGESPLPIGGHPTPSSPEAAQMLMRLQVDLRRLKEIQSIERKIEAKRTMLPEYAAWCDGLIQAAAETGIGVTDEILPTIMIWRIDTGDYAGALKLAAHVLQHKLPLPGRYERSAGTLIVEEIADAALAAFTRGQSFDFDTLFELEQLTETEDVFDEVRAKLFKAKGLAFFQLAEETGLPDLANQYRRNALTAFERARDLHDRCGVTKHIEKLQRALLRATAQASG